MELRLKPYDKNNFPLGGVLIKGSSVECWIQEIQVIGLSLSGITAYPVPGINANTIWGCLVIFEVEKTKITIGRNIYCQMVSNNLFIPERSVLYPGLSAEELGLLFSEGKYIFHPEIGFAALEESIDWSKLIEPLNEVPFRVTKPLPTLFIPGQIKSFQIKQVVPEEVLESFEEKHFPKPQKFKDKPLDLLEKARLALYKQLFRKDSNQDESAIVKTPLFSILERMKNLFSGKQDQWADNLQMDFKDLEKRNQKHLDRLMDLMKKNPKEALKYAIPLDPNGTGRGGFNGSFQMQKRWSNFSLFGNGWNSGSGGTAVMTDATFGQLHNQYWNTAKELVKQKDYQTAAFVYMKLLKNYPMAAETLEKGGYYKEAASVYLKYTNNKLKAAECFEKGNMVSNAIELYKELNQNEKVGDLYYALHKKPQAFLYYQKVADNYSHNLQYVKAALLYKNKMENPTAAQEILLKGWRANSDAFNCLNNYFSNIADSKQIWNEINLVYQNDVNHLNKETFLKVLQYEFEKKQEFSEPIKDMAYQIIVDQIPLNPSIITELRSFNKEDKKLVIDTVRFKLNLKKE